MGVLDYVEDSTVFLRALREIITDAADLVPQHALVPNANPQDSLSTAQLPGLVYSRGDPQERVRRRVANDRHP